MKKRKILFIIPALCGGGAERVLVLLLRNINHTKFDTKVITFNDINDYKNEIPSDIDITSLNKRNSFDNLRILLSLSKIIRKESPDLICSFLYYANYLSVIARFIAASEAKLIFTEHNNLTWAIGRARFGKVKKALIKLLYPFANHVICVSEGVKNDLIQNWKMNDRFCSVIYNPIEYSRIQHLALEHPSDLQMSDSSKWIVSCGRLTEQKNYSLLLRSFEIISKERDLKLIILGQGPLQQELIDLSEKLGIKNNVYFLGFKKNPFKYMSRAGVFVLSSAWEGFGNVIVEAMASGTAVVSTDCPFGPGEIIENHKNGILVSNNDEHALAKAMLTILSDSNYRESLISAGLIRAKEFEVNKIANEYEKVFMSI